MTEIGKYRPARNVKPGWHVRLASNDGEGWDWFEVQVIAGSTNIFTGRKSITFYCRDASAACGRHEDVMCRNLAEVRAAEQTGDAS